MEWEKLLNPLRTRELLGGSASLRASADTRPEFNRDYDRAIFSTCSPSSATTSFEPA